MAVTHQFYCEVLFTTTAQNKYTNSIATEDTRQILLLSTTVITGNSKNAHKLVFMSVFNANYGNVMNIYYHTHNTENTWLVG